MNWNTWLRFKMRAIFEYARDPSVRAHWSELQGMAWYVYVDDDTYVLWDELLRLLPEVRPGHGALLWAAAAGGGVAVFVGGGAGIVLSRAAALQIVSMRDSPECDPLKVAWGERTHQGGDAWLGDCADASGVHVDMEYGFYPQPPVANMFHLVSDAVAFHGVEDHHAMHAALKAEAAGGGAYDTRCTPVFLDHKYHCLPHFIIGGVPKAGTTSLYKYLMQHPEVLPAEDKELTFWGNFFSPKRRPKREEVMQEYLTKFPKIEPGDFKLTGEATPGYLYCYTCPTYILRYLPKVRFIFTLRSPLHKRSYSEYLNKVEDRTVLRYLRKRINNKMEKDLSDEAPPFAQLIDDVSKTMASCGSPNRTYSMMDEYTARNSAQFCAQFSHSSHAPLPLRYTADMERDGCYVNPFVGEGRYARYLRNWLDIVPKRQILLHCHHPTHLLHHPLCFDEWTDDAATTMRAVADFLNLAPFTFRVEEAHNTHKSRSVHVEKEGKSNAAELKAEAAIDDALGFGTYCILPSEFFRVPVQRRARRAVGRVRVPADAVELGAQGRPGVPRRVQVLEGRARRRRRPGARDPPVGVLRRHRHEGARQGEEEEALEEEEQLRLGRTGFQERNSRRGGGEAASAVSAYA